MKTHDFYYLYEKTFLPNGANHLTSTITKIALLYLSFFFRKEKYQDNNNRLLLML